MHSEADEIPSAGDIVALGAAVAPEFRGCAGVVTTVHDSHCTVIVLNDQLQNGVGECWPYFHDVLIKNRDWRLGSAVVISGMRSKKYIRLNGLSGVICSHRRQGHPCFVQKEKKPDQVWLTFCVQLDDSQAVGEKSVLVEPRFLVPCHDHLSQNPVLLNSTADLGEDAAVH